VSELATPDAAPTLETTTVTMSNDFDEPEEEHRPQQLLRDMGAYIPDEDVPKRAQQRDPADDALVVIGILAAAAALGGLTGWFIAPPLIHDLFVNSLGIESDGPEAFRRLGAFFGALLSMFAGAMFATIARR